MAVVALAAREETLGADRRNLRGSPCAVASGRVGGDDKNVNLTRFALDVSALRSCRGEFPNRSVPKECS